MTHRFSFAVAYALVLFPVMGASVASAADPAFCRQYARAALVEVHQALASPRCGASLMGARWSVEFSVQYEWCLEASVATAGAERDARTRYLKRCPAE